jgi:hypothetical protein
MSDLTTDETELLNGIDMNLSKEIITKEKNDILQRLPLDRNELKIFHKKLKGYRYINKLNDFKIGNYVRWINLKSLLDQEKKEKKEGEINIKLTNGGFICDIVENTNGKPNLLCRNNFNKLFEVALNKSIVFQKLNNHENIIMSILQYISNE